MTNILVVHGAGMDMRGKSMNHIFGPMTIDQYNEHIQVYAEELGLNVDLFHSNIEGEVINKFYQAHDGGIEAALINPAGYTSGYPALMAAIKQVKFPTYEIHVSNPASRGSNSDIARVCRGTISGCGVRGYYLGMLAAMDAIC